MICPCGKTGLKVKTNNVRGYTSFKCRDGHMFIVNKDGTVRKSRARGKSEPSKSSFGFTQKAAHLALLEKRVLRAIDIAGKIEGYILFERYGESCRTILARLKNSGKIIKILSGKDLMYSTTRERNIAPMRTYGRQFKWAGKS